MSESIDHLLRGSWTPAGAGAAPLPTHALRWLRHRIALGGDTTPAIPSSLLEVSPSALGDGPRAELVDVVGDAGVLTDDTQRLGRAGGLSYTDLIRRREGGELAVPDAVVLPGDPDEVQQVLDVCVRWDVAVVPFGGGTSVVGGVSALRGTKSAVIALDLARLDKLVSVDPVSRLVTFQAGVRGPEAESMLAAHGYTLGHVPQSFERASIGGYAATRSAGQASSGYGAFADMVEAVRMATPSGEWRLGTAPNSAAGPELRHLVLGSEGAFGVITEVTLRVRPRPTENRYEAMLFDSWETGSDVVRALAQARVLPDITRLSDPEETEVQLAMSGRFKGPAVLKLARAKGMYEPCMLVLGWEETTRSRLRQRRDQVREVLRGYRSVSLGRSGGESWRAHRFAGPRQRDALLDLGVCVETLETASTWSTLSELRSSVRAALVRTGEVRGKPPIVNCHISHAYETGASLYFTVLTPRDDRDPIAQWHRIKAAALDAITTRATGRDHGRGTITHHHAVGTDHQPWLEAEITHQGNEILKAAKQTLDPTHILNPGKLVGDRDGRSA